MKNSVKHFFTIAVLAIFLSLAFLNFFGVWEIAIEGLEFDVRTSLSYPGLTQIEIPPLGLVRANTHDTPIKLTIRLNNVNLEQIEKLLKDNPNQEQFLKRVEDNLHREALHFFFELLLMAGLAGSFSAFILRSPCITDFLKGFAAAVAAAALLMAATYKDYDVNRFVNPEYEGALKAAPWMVGLAQEAIGKIDTLSHKLQLVAQNFNDLYQQIDKLHPMQTSAGNIKVLHVSDIHNNPAAIEFIGQMAELFAVDFIIDTGDISDFGTPLEALLLKRIKDLEVPYVFIAGNHDSPDIIDSMKSLGGNVIVAEGLVELSGLRIMGFHDPASQTAEITPSPSETAAGQVEFIKDTLKKDKETSKKSVDILAVHSPYIAKPLAGTVPVLLFGHNHQFNVSKSGNSVLINAGTTGASGLGTLQEKTQRPYSLMLLHFSKTEDDASLLAVDAVQVNSTTAEFSMQRHLFGPEQDNTIQQKELFNTLESENDE